MYFSLLVKKEVGNLKGNVKSIFWAMWQIMMAVGDPLRGKAAGAILFERSKPLVTFRNPRKFI